MKLPNQNLILAALLFVGGHAFAQTRPVAPATAAVAANSSKASAETVTLAAVRVASDLWESPLARIPASVTVFDETALRAGAVRHFGDLTDQIPNLTFTGEPRVRGISRFVASGKIRSSKVRPPIPRCAFSSMISTSRVSARSAARLMFARWRSCADPKLGHLAPTPRAVSSACSPTRPRRIGPVGSRRAPVATHCVRAAWRSAVRSRRAIRRAHGSRRDSPE